MYGKKVFEYPLAQASRTAGGGLPHRGATLTDADLRRRLNLPAPPPPPAATATARRGPDSALRTTALHLSVLRAMTEHGLKKVWSTSPSSPTPAASPRTPPHAAPAGPHRPRLVPDITPELFFAHGEHTPAQRAETFTAFAAADCAILPTPA
ncbi:hypothetical protein [Streptomyces scabiei]|uniref:hypothetical protein n=1 Tax=Streptomyces scabiei TaxID=1930 RepID=UPI0027E0DF08|nr:hypothetical protein [Streptomyces sp. LBUM 1488]